MYVQMRMLTANPGLSDEVLASTRMSRAEFAAEEMKPRGLASEMYKSGKRGSHLVIIATPDVTHMSFTDTPLFKAPTAQHLHTFRIIETVTRCFFDAFLGNTGDSFEPNTGDVAVFTFPARQR
jgi:hypothetical protein